MHITLPNEPMSMETKMLAVASSAVLVMLIIKLIQTGKLREGYSILWFVLVACMLFITLFSETVFAFSGLIGIYYAPALIFAVLLVNLILIAIHYSTVLTRHEERLKTLAQEIALMKAKRSSVKKTKKSSRT
jgi:hypothetical protein